MILIILCMMILSYIIVAVHLANAIFRFFLNIAEEYFINTRMAASFGTSVLLGAYLTCPLAALGINANTYFFSLIMIVGCETYFFYRNSERILKEKEQCSFGEHWTWIRPTYILEVAVPFVITYGVMFS